MAISLNGARFLSYSVSQGLVLGQTTVVGRQGLFAPPRLLRELCRRHGLRVAEEDRSFFDEASAEWADPFFRILGAKPLEFLDASAYEGATRLHDLNSPIPRDWDASGDTLIDAGSLEHVFDVKTAFENYLRLVRVGGSVVLLDMPAVNLCGHGFYQFSPEFFCEVFSERHGFELRSLALAEDWANAPFYAVAHPRSRRRRVEILDGLPCHLFIWARKVAPFAGFARAPVQSDYAEAWNLGPQSIRAAEPTAGIAGRIRSIWKKIDLPGYWAFSTKRNKRRMVRQNAVGRTNDLEPMEL